MQIVSLFFSVFYSIFLYIRTHMHFPFEFLHVLEDIKKKTAVVQPSFSDVKSETVDANGATTSHSSLILPLNYQVRQTFASMLPKKSRRCLTYPPSPSILPPLCTLGNKIRP